MKNIINKFPKKNISKIILVLIFFLCSAALFSQAANRKKPYLVKNTAPSSSLMIEVSGPKILKEYIGYKDITEDITSEISVQVKYDDTYRAKSIEVQRYTITGFSQKEYSAFRIMAHFGENLKENINNYDEFLKVLYKPAVNGDYSLYVIDDHKFKLMKSFKSKDLVGGKFHLDSALRFTKEGGAGVTVDKGIIALIPDSEILSIEKHSTPENLPIYTISVTGEPFDSWFEEQNISPDSHFEMTGTPPHIVNYTDGKKLTVAWMESNGTKVHIQEFNESFEPLDEIVYNTNFPIFGGFTKDEKGNYFLVVAKNNLDGIFSPNIKLVKLDGRGKEVKSFSPLINREDFDVMKPIDAGTSRVVYGNGKVAVHLGKTQHKNKRDGLNHQSGILFVVNSETMEFLSGESQTWTASHSFDQRMIFDGKDFVNLDLADAFPRGIQITKKKTGRLIFTYKAGKMYQKTFTELGGLVSVSDGYLVLGASEKDFNPSNAEIYLNDSRNLFLLKVAKNFNEVKVDSKSQYLISKDIVISDGENSPEISFVDYAGNKYPQKRVGVQWLTNFKKKESENVLRPKLIQLEEDRFLAVYEKWSANSYIRTEYIIFNSSGKILQEPVDLGSARLNRKDDPVYINGNVVWTAGKKDRRELKVFVLKP
ncbi:MAG TPA: hypothetical protein PK079_18535 [Leptospiraceae bacterium]|nr:hypothetical protein [Leptospiraceae bacterium]HMW07782.1 hypothetical protein [Leptospiraceae bacterium]HMY34174.1 hypothetical protein [Leptospiraceae bacterium]HMZ64075.1 hypothetical protein [Leptospiraceae bacterium]HNA08815.1 hypothetical protein [Leptospiraceae bacterium]